MENNVNLADVQGTGREGRVLKEDILHFIQVHIEREGGQSTEGGHSSLYPGTYRKGRRAEY